MNYPYPVVLTCPTPNLIAIQPKISLSSHQPPGGLVLKRLGRFHFDYL